MQEIELAPPTAPSNPTFTKRRFFVIPLFFIVAALVLIGGYFVAQYYLAPAGVLDVTTLRSTGDVYVQGQKVGTGNFKGGFRPGDYTVKVTDDAHGALAWQGQVHLDPGALTSINLDLGPSVDSSGATVLTLTKGSGLDITSDPSGGQVSWDGANIGTTSLSTPQPTPGAHTIKIHHDGYNDRSFQVNITSGWRLKISIKLFKKINTSPTLISQEVITPQPASDLAIVSGNQSGLNKLSASTSATAYSPWGNAQFYDLSSDDHSQTSDVLAWLKGLYYYSVIDLKLPDLPFHYVIDDKGTIYQGRAGGYQVTSFDPTPSLESVAASPQTKPGVVMVGYLGPKGGVSTAATQSYHKLLTWLGQPSKLSAQLIPPSQSITISSGQSTALLLTYLNTGVATWGNSGDLKVVLTTEGQDSPFVTPGSWIDPSHVTTMNESFVPSGDQATFKLVLTAPSYGGDFTPVFNLMQGNRVAESSEYKLVIKVNGPPKPVVQVKILPTGTGFLRVRASPTINSNEVTRVTPGDTFELIGEQSGWYEIKLSNGATGWVSTQFATKI